MSTAAVAVVAEISHSLATCAHRDGRAGTGAGRRRATGRGPAQGVADTPLTAGFANLYNPKRWYMDRSECIELGSFA